VIFHVMEWSEKLYREHRGFLFVVCCSLFLVIGDSWMGIGDWLLVICCWVGFSIQLFSEQPLERLYLLVIDWNGTHDDASLHLHYNL